MVSTTETSQTSEASEKTYNLIDTDVHHILPSFDTLMPYIESGLRRRIELASNSKAEARNSFKMPRRAYFNPSSTARVDTMDADGTNHASIPQRIKEDLLDRYDITYAILMGNDLTTISGMPDPDLAAGIALEPTMTGPTTSGFNPTHASNIQSGLHPKTQSKQQQKSNAGATTQT